MVRLENKIALVTGAAGGIGRSVCQRFVAEGAKVAVLDQRASEADQLVAELGGAEHALALGVDVGDVDQVQAAIAHTVASFGGLNILCNVAGGSSPSDGPVTDAPVEEFWRVIRTDLFGTFLVCKFGIPELIKAGGGSVINLSSMAAVMALPGRDGYTAAKGGVSAITRSMAMEYGKQGIRVNAIAPGATLTPRVTLQAMTEHFPEIVERSILGVLDPVDIAHAAVFLASEESVHLTGQVISVDSGVTIT